MVWRYPLIEKIQELKEEVRRVKERYNEIRGYF